MIQLKMLQLLWIFIKSGKSNRLIVMGFRKTVLQANSVVVAFVKCC